VTTPCKSTVSVKIANKFNLKKEQLLPLNNKYIQQRIEKAEALKAAGLNPYANNSQRNTSIEKYLNVNSDIIETEDKRDENRHYIVSGRIKFLRVMGKASFIKIEDESGMLQIYVARDNLPEDSITTLSKNL
jgi:lysyl-tRNA synthetase class 2